MKLAVIGPSGRMGGAVLDAAQRANVKISGLLDSSGSPLLGSSVSGCVVTDDPRTALQGADAYIDFSTPEATRSVAQAACELKVAAVVGTTALEDETQAALDALARVSPVVVAANFSLGVNLLEHLTRLASRSLSDYDCEIVEIHHKRKVDAPSGTAIFLGEAAAQGREQKLDDVKVTGRDGIVGGRSKEEIGMLAVRGGDVIGDHTVYFFGEEERIELTHRASKRSVFAGGALKTAQWLMGKGPGHYTMANVLGLDAT